MGPKGSPALGAEVGGSGPNMGKEPRPAARIPAAGSPGPWCSTAAGWGEVQAWGCASRSGISPHCPLAAEGLCWGDRGTEAGAMGSPASCPFSSMLAQSGDGKVERWMQEANPSGVGGHLLLLLNLCNLFPARWALGGGKTGAEYLSPGPELRDQGPGLGEGQTPRPRAKSVKVLLTSIPELWGRKGP